MQTLQILVLFVFVGVVVVGGTGINGNTISMLGLWVFTIPLPVVFRFELLARYAEAELAGEVLRSLLGLNSTSEERKDLNPKNCNKTREVIVQ